MRSVKIEKCQQCIYFTHLKRHPMCSGLGVPAKLKYQEYETPDAYMVKPDGTIPVWCVLEQVK